MQVHVGFNFIYDSPQPSPMLFVVQPLRQDRHQLLHEVRTLTPDVPITDYIDLFGNRVWRLVAPAGLLEVHYTAQVEVSPDPDLVLPILWLTPVEQLPYDTLVYTLPSRYCDSDLFINDAWRLFGETPPNWSRIQAVCDWVHQNIRYEIGSTSHTSAHQAYQARRGVCRDFAHIAISFCRALNIPARYVAGFLPDIGVPIDPKPMDFHAWFEAYIDGVWHTFDARHNQPRIGRVVIGRGRDAVDVALTTTYGPSQLVNFSVWADKVAERSPLHATQAQGA